MYNEGVSTLASAGSHVLDPTTKRPTQGYVMLNVLSAPTEIQSNETQNQYQFMTYIHEIFHALGISESRISNWHPQDSYTPHANPTCTLVVGGMTRKIVTTKYSHLFAVKHLGTETFTGDDGTSTCPSGIFLEDRGGSGTAGSHPEWRLYYTDLMVGITVNNAGFPFERLTEVSMALLMDTGYYEVEWANCKPIWWGHKQTNGGEYIANFATGAPQLVFPKGYLYKFSANGAYYSKPGFTYDYIGGTGSSYTLDDTAMNNIDWYNPLNETTGHYVADYQKLIYPMSKCASDEAALETNSNAKCYKVSCSADKSSMTFGWTDYSGAQTGTCTTEGQQVDAFNYTSPSLYYKIVVTCPNIKDFCMRLEIRDMDFFTRDPFSNESDWETSSSDASSSLAADTSSDQSSVETSSSMAQPSEDDTSGKENSESASSEGTTEGEEGIMDKLQSFFKKATEGTNLYITIAVVVAIVLVIVIISCCCCRKKNKKKNKKGKKNRKGRRHYSSSSSGSFSL